MTRGPPFKSGFPSNSGLQASPLSPPFSLSISQCGEGLSISSIDTPPFMVILPPFIFFQTPCFWQDFSDNIAPMKYQINTKINSCGKVIFSFLEDLKTTLNALL